MVEPYRPELDVSDAYAHPIMAVEPHIPDPPRPHLGLRIRYALHRFRLHFARRDRIGAELLAECIEASEQAVRQATAREIAADLREEFPPSDIPDYIDREFGGRTA